MSPTTPEAATAPFVVFSLPRSRSTWLSVFLGAPGRRVGHDIGVDCATPEEFVAPLSDGSLAGTCETGAAFAWRLIREALPTVTFGVVKRPVDEVCGSLERLGFQGVRPEIEQRAAQLEEISAQPGTMTIDYAELGRVSACAGLFAHCTRRPLDLGWWQQMESVNVQIDIRRQVEKLAANAERIEALKAEVARRLAKPGYTVALEPWTTRFWRDAQKLAADHFEEVDGGVEPKRVFKLDEPFMNAMAGAGVLKVIAARLDGRLVGYFTWSVVRDVESEGLRIAQQGAWYVEPGHPRIALQMFKASVKELQALGVQCMFPHHRAQGRGAALGKFFKRQGAKKIQDTYSLWIGD